MKHHYIPQFYLRPWLGPDHKLQEFRRGYDGRIQTGRYGTKATGYEIDLYTLPGVTEDTKHNIERVFMGLVDSNAADIRDMLLDGRVPGDPEQRHAWTMFMLSLVMRHPESIAKFKARFAKDYAKPSPKLQAQYETLKRAEHPDTLEEFLLAMDPTAAERQAVITFTHLVQNENTAKLIRGMSWAVVDTSRVSRKLMTSDRPLLTTNGLGRFDGHLGLTISPDRLFLAATFPKFLDSLLRLPIGKLVRNVNDAVIGQGRKYVYAVDNANFGEVKRRMSKRDYLNLLPGMDVEIV